MVLGHVNATGGGPGVFADLPVLTPGDEIRVQRADGTQAQFRVTHAERYAKDAFPTMRVYGTTAAPQLRLITCDRYDPATGTFDENLVAYATLVTRGTTQRFPKCSPGAELRAPRPPAAVH